MQATQGTLSSLPSVCLSYAFRTRSQSVCPAPTSPSHFDHRPVFSFPSVALLQHLFSASRQLGFPPDLCHYNFLSHLSVHPYLLSVHPFPRLCLTLFIPTCHPSRQASLQRALLSFPSPKFLSPSLPSLPCLSRSIPFNISSLSFLSGLFP